MVIIKLLHLRLLEPVDCFGKKPDGTKQLIKEATRDAPALYTVSELEAYKSFMVVQIGETNHKIELFVKPVIVDVEGGERAALYVLRELCHEASEMMKQNFNQQVNDYMQRNPHAPR